MAAPQLPKSFGNLAIQGIEEVVPPEPISWLPATVGWQGLLVLALLAIAWFLFRGVRRWRRNRYRRDALHELEQVADSAPGEQVAIIAMLLKATALQAYPRGEVAALSGDAWLNWLDAAGASLSEASRQLLCRQQYRQAAEAEPGAVDTLAEEVADWIRNHQGVQS